MHPTASPATAARVSVASIAAVNARNVIARNACSPRLRGATLSIMAHVMQPICISISAKTT